jgi:hypothetical protein
VFHPMGQVLYDYRNFTCWVQKEKRYPEVKGLKSLLNKAGRHAYVAPFCVLGVRRGRAFFEDIQQFTGVLRGVNAKLGIAYRAIGFDDHS